MLRCLKTAKVAVEELQATLSLGRRPSTPRQAVAVPAMAMAIEEEE